MLLEKFSPNEFGNLLDGALVVENEVFVVDVKE